MSEWSNRMTQIINGQKPSDVKTSNAVSTWIHWEQMFLQCLSQFQIENVPEEWDEEYMKVILLLEGHIAITDTELGVVPLSCGIAGINLWNRPTRCIFANPILGSFEREIGVNCALIHLKPDFMGISPWFDLYSTTMGLCDSAVAVNLINTKATFIGEVSDKSEASEMKKMYDQISEGKPAVFVRDGLPGNFQFLNPKQSFIADSILDVKHTIQNEWLARIGIRGVDEKKERLISAEVEDGNDAVDYNVYHMVETANRGFAKANSLYGMNLKIVLHSEEVKPSGNSLQSPNSEPGNDE